MSMTSNPAVVARERTTPVAMRWRNALSLVDRTVWRDAGLMWLAQHVLLAVVTYVGRALFAIPSFSTQSMSWATLFDPWLAWDGAHFADVATHGYTSVADAAYYPLFPLLEHILGSLTWNTPEIAGVLVANAAGLGAFVLFRLLAERELGLVDARRSLLYLAVFPTAFFLAAPYTESLFLVLSLGAFLAMRRGNWLLAGGLAALATLTRAVGLALLVPLVIEAVMQWRASGAVASIRARLALAGGVALPLAAMAGYSLYLYRLFGILSPSAGEQATDWQRGLAVPGLGFARAGAQLLRIGADPSFQQVHILLDMAFTLLFIALTIATWQRLPLSYVAYAGAMLLLVLAEPAHNWYALGSNMRFMLVVFPLFMLLGKWGAVPWVDRLILACSLPLLALFTVAFLQTWIA